MKAPPFQYIRPESIIDVLELLAMHGEEARIIAGGQSLVPILNFRLASPDLLIDINRIAELRTVEKTDTCLRLGALVRWSEVESNALIAGENPLLQEAVRHVAHYQIRNRGTVGGSSAHADPAAEFPAVALACDATFVIRNAAGARTLSAAEFFLGPLFTALQADELLTAIEFPLWPPHRRYGFQEFSRRQGDFALAGAVTLIDRFPDARHRAGLVSFGVSDQARRLHAAERAFDEGDMSGANLATVAKIAARESEAKSDIHAPADYREALLEELMYRALCDAVEEIREEAFA
ncbi:MAG TPA: xanthine dehydrogenase family protein subunit M [Burkholderiales bacterium]|nr:xanthine dehydrogenase family protein subunit M [Burkholderiales bacterium]